MLSEHLCEGNEERGFSKCNNSKNIFPLGAEINIQAATTNVNIWKVFTITTLYFTYY